MTSGIPDSFSQEDLQDLLDKAPKEDSIACKKQTDGPFNGHSQKELQAAVVDAIEKLETKFKSSMVLKALAIECLSDLISIHTNVGIDYFKRNDEDYTGVYWLRDAGKAQAAMSILCEIELPDDFLTKG